MTMENISRRTFLIGATAAAAAVATPIGFASSVPAMAVSPGPTGWLLCNGAELECAEFPKLAEVLGKVYGGSNETFKLPDMRARVITYECREHPLHKVQNVGHPVETIEPFSEARYMIASDTFQTETPLGVKWDTPAGVIMPFAFIGGENE